jgi:hypothetical protein
MSWAKGNFEFVPKGSDDVKSQRKALLFVARTAEAAERYEDMARFMRNLVKFADTNKAPLTIEERNLLSVAYKNVIGARRASWRTMNRDDVQQDFADIAGEYKRQVETELKGICEDILSLLEDSLIPLSDSAQAAIPDDSTNEKKEAMEAHVFYLKMAGDYYRYRAESASKDDTGHDQKSGDYYKKSYDYAVKYLLPTHPIRLGLALNYSVCHYEILDQKTQACEIAKSAFDQAIAQLDTLDEAAYKDSTLIMQLLRDNLTLWTANDDSNE